MKAASAPVSWGITEAEAGYQGTELGPWGFYPTSPDELDAQLADRGIALVGAFVDVPLHEPALFDGGRRAVRRVIPLLAELGAQALILSAQGTPDRAKVAGRVEEEHGLTTRQWRPARAYLQELALMGVDAGLTPTFHHHAGTYVETPVEIERLLNEVDPDLLGLCLDTGHLAYGGGDNLRAIASYGRVIRHVHLKNTDPSVLERARADKLGYLRAVRAGVFCPLDAGSVPIPQVIEALKGSGYDGWLVVEQDVDLSQPDHPDPIQGALRAREYLKEVANI
jgi:inosose dehydratase